MMRGSVLLMLLTVAGLTGCLTMSREEVILDPIAARKFAKDFTDPRYYGLGIYQAEDGSQHVADGFRLHYFQKASLPMQESSLGFAPVIKVKARFYKPQLALVDIASPECWVDLDLHNEFRLKTLGYQQPMPYRGKRELGGASAYRSLCPQISLNTLAVENALFYTRLATGGLGPLDRNIKEPPVGLVLGWDLIRRFELVRFDFAEKRVSFVSTEACDLDEALLTGAADIRRVPGHGCVVVGKVGGQPQLFVLDPAGDFELALPGGTESVVKELSIGSLVLRDVNAKAAKLDGKLPHIGGRLLSKYAINLCPRKKKVYFEFQGQGQ